MRSLNDEIFKQICAPIFILIATTANADNIKLAVTTSFNNSGLSDVLLPKIKSDIGLNIKLLVVGPGKHSDLELQAMLMQF